MSDDYASCNNLQFEDEKLYPVEKIVGRRLRKGKVEYRVRWKNYSPETDSWEPSKSLQKTCQPLIKEFNSTLKLHNISNSTGTSTKSSNEAAIITNKINKLPNNLSNLENNIKSVNLRKIKYKTEHNSRKFKHQNKSKSPNSTDKSHVENNEKLKLNCAKLNKNLDKHEYCTGVIKIANDVNSYKNGLANHTNDYDRNPKCPKNILYLDDNNIYEPCVPKSKTSILNGVSPTTLSLTTIKPIEIVPRKPQVITSISPSILKRKSISLISEDQKKIKVSENGFKVTATVEIENECNQHPKNSNVENNINTNRYKQLKPVIFSKPLLISQDKVEKSIRNLPFQRYKESEHCDNSDSGERRTSIRQIEAANRFREIIVRKNITAGFTEICLHNNSHSFPNSFNIKILNELHIALKQAINDSSRIILISAIGSVFSSGIDLESIISSSQKCVSNGNTKTLVTATTQLTTPQFPYQLIQDLVESLKKFLLELLHFPKPIVVGINGPAIGLGCAILPLCDLIYATESSSFCLPYTTLSQIPEAGSSLTLPVLIGMPAANQLLLCGRKWCAKEALNRGLISEIIFSDKFKAELFSRCEKLAHVPSMSAETMKCLLRIHYKDQIDMAINVECRKLIEIWKSNEFRSCAQSFVTNELPNLLL